MGKHSAPESPGFWRAVIIAFFRYLVVLLAIAAVGFGIYRFVFADVEPEQGPGGLEETPTLGADFTSPSPTALIGQGEDVQILNGTASEEQPTLVEQKLVANGYEIVAREPAASQYEQTTVFYQPDSQQLGTTVASLLGATVVREATENLNPDIPVTVVVGADYSG